jgi:hypothetical protein
MRTYRGKNGKKNRVNMMSTDCYATKDPSVLAESKAMPKILIFDIETTPNLAWVWGMYKQFISPAQVVQNTDILCYSGKWLGKKKIIFDSKQHDKDDRRICETLWHLFDEADIVVAHNGDGFDVKIMNARWLSMGFNPPSPYKSVDTLKMVKAKFRFPMNKLDYLARYLNIGKKVEHEGFDLWIKCMNGVKSAWDRMRKYNIEDVRLLEEFYLLIRAWDNRHPNVAIMYDQVGEKNRCVICGSDDLKDEPKASYTNVSIFPTVRCNNCGKAMRTAKRDETGKKILRHSL